jgi:hypothetical protein
MLDAAFVEGLQDAVHAAGDGGHIQHVTATVGGAAQFEARDEGDPPVAVVDEVLCGRVGGGPDLDFDHVDVEVVDVAVEKHEWAPGLAQVVEVLGAGEGRRCHDHTVDTLFDEDPCGFDFDVQVLPGVGEDDVITAGPGRV